MSKVELVVFDADGTLFDSNAMIHAAYAHVAQTHGLPEPSHEEIHSHIGKPIREILADVFPGSDVEQLFATNEAYVAVNFLEAQPFDGLVDTLDFIQQQGIKLAILTSASNNIHHILKHHEVDRYFTSVVHSERVHKYKPDPEGFLLAAQECDVVPGSAVMVGDMWVDIEVAQRAKALAGVGITHGFGTRESLEAVGADYIIDSLAELPAVLKKIG